MKKLRASLACTLLAVGACRQVIGIEDAEVDPALDGRGGSSNAQTAGIGGAGTEPAGDGSERPPDEDGSSTGGESTAAEEGGASGGGAAGQASAPPEASLCERYCNAVMENCTGALAVYTSYAVCLAVCGELPPGSEGDRSGNTVQCRLRAARAAPDEAPHYCSIAGPGGNGVCGSNCEALCTLQTAVCGGDLGECGSACARLADLGSYSTHLDAGQHSGAHVQCRLFHTSAAANRDAAQHCAHAAGAPPCQ